MSCLINLPFSYQTPYDIQWNLYKADTSIRRAVWQGTDCLVLRLSYLRKNLYKPDISLKRTLFSHQWCSLSRDSTVETSPLLSFASQWTGFYYYYYYLLLFIYLLLLCISGFLSHVYIKVNRLFTPVKKNLNSKAMSKQSAITPQNQQKKHKKRS